MSSTPPKFSPVPSLSPEELDFQVVRQRVGDVVGRWLARGFQLGKETLRYFQLDDWAPNPDELSKYVPTMEQVLYHFSDEDLGLLTEYQKPTVVIRPPRKNYQDLMGALVCHYRPSSQTGPVVTERHSIDWGMDNEFRPFILEAACEIQPKHDILSGALGGRMGRRYELRKEGEYGMTSELYMLLAMQSIVRGKMIDQKTFTILDGNRIIADRYVGRGQCLKGQPSIDWVPIDDESSVRGRFRRVLKGTR